MKESPALTTWLGRRRRAGGLTLSTSSSSSPARVEDLATSTGLSEAGARTLTGARARNVSAEAAPSSTTGPDEEFDGEAQGLLTAVDKRGAAVGPHHAS